MKIRQYLVTIWRRVWWRIVFWLSVYFPDAVDFNNNIHTTQKYNLLWNRTRGTNNQ